MEFCLSYKICIWLHIAFCNSVITTLFSRQCSQFMLIWMLANCSKCLSWGYNLIDGYYSAFFASIIPTNMLSVSYTCYAVKHWLCKVILSIPRTVSLYYEEIAKHILPFLVKNPSDPDTIKWCLPNQVGKVVFGIPKKMELVSIYSPVCSPVGIRIRWNFDLPIDLYY